MTGRPDRLVRRIQRRQQSSGPEGSAVSPTTREIGELEARVRRLRALGGRFRRVRLSSYVAQCDLHEARLRVGGDGVATEV